MPLHQSTLPIAQLRLFVLFLAIAFSFGGFTFYAAVVVPIGGKVFDVTAQGFITQRVTHVLNAGSAITLVALIWEAVAAQNVRMRWENVFFFGLVALFMMCLSALQIIHPLMDKLLDERTFSVAQPDRFYLLHRIYLAASTVQWLSTLGLIWFICQTHCRTSQHCENKAI